MQSFCGSEPARDEAVPANKLATARHKYVQPIPDDFPHRPILVLYCLQ
jgi:hypothetical protein